MHKLRGWLAPPQVWPGQAWLRRALEVSAPQLGSYHETGLSNCCWALARLAALPAEGTPGVPPLQQALGAAQCTGEGQRSGGAPSVLGGQLAGEARPQPRQAESSGGAAAGAAAQQGGESAGGTRQAAVLALLRETGWLSALLVVAERRCGRAVCCSRAGSGCGASVYVGHVNTTSAWCGREWVRPLCIP